MKRSTLTFEKPFPALTPAQRLHLDVYGYVVIENTLSPEEVERLQSAVKRLRDRLCNLGESGRAPGEHGSAYLQMDKPHHHYMTNILGADPDITAYATHPWMVGMAEEFIGGEARIVEMNVHINRRDPDESIDDDARTRGPRFSFHRGADAPFACHMQDGLWHCNFVKTLTTLTDLGPDDGGTVVIAGSHKLDLPASQLIELAYEDRSLIHQFVAPAGSTLLFGETLIHATGQIRSDAERVVIITGYGPIMFPYWELGGQSDSLAQDAPDHLRPLIAGQAHWNRAPRYRSLSEAADERRFELGRWDDRRPFDRAGQSPQRAR